MFTKTDTFYKINNTKTHRTRSSDNFKHYWKNKTKYLGISRDTVYKPLTIRVKAKIFKTVMETKHISNRWIKRKITVDFPFTDDTWRNVLPADLNYRKY